MHAHLDIRKSLFTFENGTTLKLDDVCEAMEFAIDEMTYRVAEWTDDDEETRANRAQQAEKWRTALLQLQWL